MQIWRVNLVLVLIFIFGAAIIGRLLFLQVFNRDFYKALAKGQQIDFTKQAQDRGEVFMQDRKGNLYPLAINKKETSVYVRRDELTDKEKAAKELSQILMMEDKAVLEKIDNGSPFHQIIKDRLSDSETTLLKKAGLKGVYLEEKNQRYYPQAELAASVIGFLGGEGKGQYGVEGYYDDVLSGRENLYQGKDLILTLDYNIQSKAEELLKYYQSRLGFPAGQILVLEPKTGKIKTLVNLPGFDPNQYNKETDQEKFQNGALQKIFEPGSVFKPITMAAGLQEEKLTPETTYRDNGFAQIGAITIYNYDQRVWGERTMTEVLEKSINTGAVFAEQQLGHKLFADYVEKFGFYELTGVDLQGEVFSSNQSFKKGYEINYANASFGQGIEMTLMQLARAYCVIANGGRMVKPYIVASIREPDGQTTDMAGQVSLEAIISPKAASQIAAMLASVVKNGFAKAAQVPGYYLGGKTGTAQVSWSALGIHKSGYSEKTIQSFAGFGPLFDPKFLILVKLDDPAAKTAEYSAVPIFQELAKYIIDYWEIPPDYE